MLRYFALAYASVHLSEDSWIVILNCSEGGKDKRWEVLDLNAENGENVVVKQYGGDFGELAALAYAAEMELKLVAGVDHVLNRMQRSLFDYARQSKRGLTDPLPSHSPTFSVQLATK